MKPKFCPTHELANTQNPNTITIKGKLRNLYLRNERFSYPKWVCTYRFGMGSNFLGWNSHSTLKVASVCSLHSQNQNLYKIYMPRYQIGPNLPCYPSNYRLTPSFIPLEKKLSALCLNDCGQLAPSK